MRGCRSKACEPLQLPHCGCNLRKGTSARTGSNCSSQQSAPPGYDAIVKKQRNACPGKGESLQRAFNTGERLQ